MVKVNLCSSLKTVFLDINNINTIIQESKTLEESCSEINFDDEKQAQAIIDKTKTIVKSLESVTSKITNYFNENYNSWVDNLPRTDIQSNQNSISQDAEDVTLNSKTSLESAEINDCSNIEENKSSSKEPPHVSQSENSELTDVSHKLVNTDSPTNENNILKNVNDNDSLNNELGSLNKSEEPKTFLKCVDIKKLVNSDGYSSFLTSIKTNGSKNNGDDSILIISDSDEETTYLNRSSRRLRRKKNGNSFDKAKLNSTAKSVKRSTRNRNRDVQHLEIISSLSDSSTSSLHSSKDHKVTSRRKVEKVRTAENDSIEEITKNDKKFTYEAYVPLPRIPCEKLLELYLKKKEIREIKTLTNLKNLRKKERDSPSPQLDKKKSKSKKKRDNSRKSSSSGSSSCMSSDCDSNSKTPITDTEMVDNLPIASSKDLSDDTMEVVLDSINSATHSISANDSDSSKSSDSESTKTKEKGDKENQKETKKTIPGSSTQSEKRDDKKSTWKNDPLLKEKLTDSESEDEFIAFKKNTEKAKETIKNRLFKKTRKNLLGSDSESGDENKNSGDESKDKSSDIDEHKSDEEDSTVKTKKRRRIKRMDDSSSDDGKTTRKTIRKVIAHDSLAETTKQAEKEEKERKQRISERQKKYNKIFDGDLPQDAVVDKLVLDFNEESNKELLCVHEDIVKKLKPHQGKGVQFMWDACFESLERIKSTEGSGCILAHCMGLGKTLQVITLAHTLLTNEEKTGIKTVLVVCPVSTGLNWVDEFDKWLHDIDGSQIEVFDLISVKQNMERSYQVKQWSKHGGVMVVGYDMFRNLTNINNKRIKKSDRAVLQRGFVDPGPDLIICDEGHLLKNEKSNISIAMNRIRSKRRIVLTGTPMQNNLKEYYCMVQFVKPNLLGTYKEYLNRFVNPITNGQYTDSTPHDINIMRKRSHVLHKMLDGLVQRKDYSVLTPYLPPKHEYVLFIKLSETQIQLYEHYLRAYSRKPVAMKRATFLFIDFQQFQRICTHPRVLLNKSIEDRKKDIFNDDDDEEESEGSLKDFINDDSDDSTAESVGSSNSSNSSDSHKSKSRETTKRTNSKRLTRTAAAAAGIDVAQEVVDLEQVEENEWWRQHCTGAELDNIAHSGKLFLLFEILQQCELIGDKLLVFSQSLYSLDIIEYFLGLIDEATQKGESEKVCGFSGSWSLGLDYFRMDGSSSCDNRAAWCKSFNNPNNFRARLFLISTRAGGLGINLTGANRVIIFDVSWNPSHDIQSIYRIYRFGQTKPCYIYRFVTWGTMEMKIYERQVTKQAISKRVIDEQQIDRHYNQNDLTELYKFDPTPTEDCIPLVPKDVLLAEMLQKQKDRIYKYHEHQTLLENKEDEELNEEERKTAWEEYENEKTNRAAFSNNLNTTGGWIKNLPMSTIHIALLNIVQKDNPTWTPEQIRQVIPHIVNQLQDQLENGNTTLYDRVTTEIRSLAERQRQIHQYYVQQQMQMYQQNRQAAKNTKSTRHDATTNRDMPSSSQDVIEINET